MAHDEKTMDVLWFLKERASFIRYYYETTAGAFEVIQHRIREGEEPFDDPPWDDSGEPPFMLEWSQAEEGRRMTGRVCVSILSGTMQRFFQTWEAELHINQNQRTDQERAAFKKGMMHGYRHVFESRTGCSWEDSGADLAILEQVTLARNSDQHTGDLITHHTYHSEPDRQKYAKLFFVNEMAERWPIDSEAPDSGSPFSWIEVSRDKLFKAIAELETLAEWLNPKLEELWRKQGR